MFSKSANPLDLPQKSTIRAIFEAKSVDPKTYSPPSISEGCHVLYLCRVWRLFSKLMPNYDWFQIVMQNSLESCKASEWLLIPLIYYLQSRFTTLLRIVKVLILSLRGHPAEFKLIVFEKTCKNLTRKLQLKKFRGVHSRYTLTCQKWLKLAGHIAMSKHVFINGEQLQTI